MSLADPAISTATEADLPRLFEVWESSVRATHAFLTPADLDRLIPLVRQGLAHFAPIHCLRDSRGEAYAFLGVEQARIEMLFVHAAHRGQGAGRRLARFAIERLGATQVDVNEQNPLAIGFYEHLGFRTFARSEFDASGHPFPILHLQLPSGPPPGRCVPGRPSVTVGASNPAPGEAMKQLQFTTLIEAAPGQVWETLLGPVTYRIWTAAFTEGSYFEGTWAKGERMRFLAPGGNGMVSEIAELRPQEFLSIKHLGEIKNGVEDTESEAVRSWTPCFENYTLTPAGAATELRVDMDMAEAFEEYMAGTWPKALSLLKALCEARAARPQA